MVKSGGKAGMRSGKVFGKIVTGDDRLVLNREWLPASEYMISTSGTSARATSGVIADQYILAFAKAADAHISFNFIAPTYLPRKTKADLVIYWTSTGGSTEVNSGVVWDINYRTANISGIGSNKLMTGDLTNITNSGTLTGIANELYKTTLTIPAKDIRSGDIVRCLLYRDVSAEDYGEGYGSNQAANLLGILIEYMEE